jgi:hypothetical protein
MRKFFFSILILSYVSGLFAQSGVKPIDIAFAELCKDVKSAQYLKARMEIKSMQSIMDSLIGIQVAEAFPKQVEMWILTDSRPEATGQSQRNAAYTSVSQGANVDITKYYVSKVPITNSQPKPNESPENHSVTDDPHHGSIQPGISITVTNSMMDLSSFITNYNEQKTPSASANANMYQTLSYRIQNYRTLDTRNPSMKMRQLEIIVGSAIVRINIQGLEDTSIALKIAEKINFTILKQVFGE